MEKNQNLPENEEIHQECEKWARFLYDLWQKEKVKKTKENRINE